MNYNQPFLILPKELFSRDFSELSHSAKLLYSFMLERRNISQKNNWTDEGETYIIFTIESISAGLDISPSKAVRLIKELEGQKLIRKKKQGMGRPDKIFVKPLIEPQEKKYSMATYNMEDLKKLINR